MAKPELGTKRECPECAVKYYDLARSPCVCPKCGAGFKADAAAPSRIEKVKKPKDDKVTKAPPSKEKAKTASLDELGTEERDGEETADDSDEAALADIDIPDEEDEDEKSETNDAFLDTEDDDTDVSGLLGTGIGKGDDEG